MVYLFLADGFEDIEAIAVIDILRRAEIPIKTVGVGNSSIISAHGVKITADLKENEAVFNENVDAIILPGGMPGTINLSEAEIVKKAIRFSVDNNKYICAICAAPYILGNMGLLNGTEVTCFPGFENYLIGAKIKNNSVCSDKNIITSKGAGCAMEFAFEIIKHLKSLELAQSIKESMQC